MYKIFINNKPLVLSESQDYYKGIESSILLKTEDKEELLFIVEAIENQEKVESAFVASDDIDKLWEEFKSEFTFIESAGGIVKNDNNDTLFIHRFGKWDLPKGKVNDGESDEQAATREVEEECGITGLTITKPIEATYYTYSVNESKILKKVQWFEMLYSGSEAPAPQKDEGITEVKWFGEADLADAMENTYQSVQDLFSV